MSLSYAVDFRGHPACPCLAAWLPVYEAELQHRGILKGPLHIYQLIGGAAASAGAHTKGGAFDLLDLPGNADLRLARDMGADAAWSRPRNWDGRGGISHMHGILTGCPHALHASVAANQITAVRAGFNGLGHLGRGGRDTGPRPLSGRTWQQGIEWIKEQDMNADQDQRLKAVEEQVDKMADFQLRSARRIEALFKANGTKVDQVGHKLDELADDLDDDQ